MICISKLVAIACFLYSVYSLKIMVFIKRLTLQMKNSSCTAREQVLCCSRVNAFYTALILTKGLLSFCKCHFTSWLKIQSNYSGHL